MNFSSSRIEQNSHFTDISVLHRKLQFQAMLSRYEGRRARGHQSEATRSGQKLKLSVVLTEFLWPFLDSCVRISIQSSQFNDVLYAGLIGTFPRRPFQFLCFQYIYFLY